MRRDSAIPRSSPKFGRVTMMPSISSRWDLNRSAHCLRLGARLDRAVLGLLRREADGLVAGALERGNHLLAAALREMVGEKPAVPDDQSKCHDCSSGCKRLQLEYCNAHRAGRVREARLTSAAGPVESRSMNSGSITISCSAGASGFPAGARAVRR